MRMQFEKNNLKLLFSIQRPWSELMQWMRKRKYRTVFCPIYVVGISERPEFPSTVVPTPAFRPKPIHRTSSHPVSFETIAPQYVIAELARSLSSSTRSAVDKIQNRHAAKIPRMPGNVSTAHKSEYWSLEYAHK